MGSVLLFDAARMKQIEDTTVVSGLVGLDGHLLLLQRDGVQIDAGYVKGDDGQDGIPGTNGTNGTNGKDGLIAAGMILDWPSGVPAPIFAKDCNGAAVSRSLYSALYGVVGNKYGSGDGSTTFNLPDFKTEQVVLGEAYRGNLAQYVLTASFTDIPGMSVTAKSDGSPVRVDISQILANGGSGADRVATVQLLCDNVVVAIWNNNRIALSGGGDERYTFAQALEHTPGAGSHTWKVQAVASISSAVVAHHGTIVVNQVNPTGMKKIIVVSDQGTPNTYIPEGMAFGIGMIVAWPGVAGAPIPANTLELNGQTVSASVYSGLAALFPAWVQGTDLTLPDLRKRTIAGHLTGDAKFGTLGGMIGADSHLLTANQSGIRPHSHAITGRSTSGAGGSGDNMMRGTGGVDPNFRTSTFVGTTESYNSPAAEPNALEAHNNVQPTYIGRWLIIASDGAGEFSPTVQASLTARVAELETRPIGRVSRLNGVAYNSGVWNLLNDTANWLAQSPLEGFAPFNGTWVVPVDGIYAIDAQFYWAAAINTIIQINKNSTVVNAGVIMTATSVGTAGYTAVQVAGERKLAAGDVLRLWLYGGPYSGGATLYAGNGNEFGIRLVRKL